MDQQTADRIEAKLDELLDRLDRAERTLGAFLAGPGAKLARLFGKG